MGLPGWRGEGNALASSSLIHVVLPPHFAVKCMMLMTLFEDRLYLFNRTSLRTQARIGIDRKEW